MKKNNLKDYFVVATALLLLVVGASLVVSFEDLLYPPAIQQVIAPLVIITMVFRFFTSLQVAKLWYWAGIPLGVTSSAICLLSLLHSVESPEGFEQEIALSLISLGYGLAASMLGYAFSAKVIHPVGDQRNPASTTIKVFVVAAVLICLLVSIELQVGLSAVVDVSASMLIASPVLLGVYRSKANARADGVMTCLMFGALACVFVGLIGYLFSGLDPKGLGPATATGLAGLIYSGLGLVGTMLFCEPEELEQANVSRKNWHLMEIYALWVLMCFAPMSLRESFSLVG